MKDIALVTPCYFGRDGVGNSIRDYLAALEHWRWSASIYHEQQGLNTEKVKSHCCRAEEILQELLSLDYARESGFPNHSFYLYQFVFYYPLLETVRSIDSGKVIFEYHGITPPKFFLDEDPYKAKALDIMNRHDLLDYGDAVVVHSKSMESELRDIWSVPKERVHVIPLGVDSKFTPGVPDKELERTFPPPSSPLLLYVGRLSGNKRVPMLIEMLGKLKRLYPNAQLIVLGAHDRTTCESYWEHCKKVIEEEDLFDSVHFLSNVNDDELPKYYRMASLYVSASVHEGFGLPIAEAMACGTPCVVANVSASPETMGDGGLTFLADSVEDMTQKVAEALKPKKREKLSQNALERVEMYRPKAFRKRLASLFERVAQQERRKRPILGRRKALLDFAQQSRFFYEEKNTEGLWSRLLFWFRRKATLPFEVSLLRKQRNKQALVNDSIQKELESLKEELKALKKFSPP